jgi:hypothetical protein
MTISKGSDWGFPGTLTADTPVFDNDADAATHIAKSRELLSTPTIVLTGGVLWTTMGGPGAIDRYRTDAALHYRCDLVMATVNQAPVTAIPKPGNPKTVNPETANPENVTANGGTSLPFIGSLIARSFDWRHTFAAMNAQTYRDFRFGHRAHPNDGLVDIYDANVSLGDVAKIAKRARLGSHLPHPGITERRVCAYDVQFRSSRQLWLDERRVGSVRTLAIRVIPDAFIVVL